MGNLPEHSFPHRRVRTPTGSQEKMNQSSGHFAFLCVFVHSVTQSPRREQDPLSPWDREKPAPLRAAAQSKGLIQAQARRSPLRRPGAALAPCETPNFSFEPSFALAQCPRPASMEGLVHAEHKAAFARGAKKRKAAAEVGGACPPSPPSDWPHSSPAQRGPCQGTHGSELPSASLLASGECK